jgi:PPE-repeat protein
LAALIATNFFGQNTSAIAATEAIYGEYWAQDAAAMYSYAGSSATASRLTSFTDAPTTTSGTTASQLAADGSGGASSFLTDLQAQLTTLFTQLNSSVGSLSTDLLGSLPTAPTWTWSGFTDITNVAKSLTNIINTVSGPYTPLGIAGLIKNWYQVSISIPNLGVGIQGIGPLTHPKALSGVLSPLLRSELLTGSAAVHPTGAAVSAAAGRASLIGSLSVPPNWVSSVPAVRMAALSMPEAVAEAAPEIAANGQMGMFGQSALSSLAGRAFGDTATRSVSRTSSRTLGNVPRFTDGVVAEDIGTTATIIVIPPNAE